MSHSVWMVVLVFGTLQSLATGILFVLFLLARLRADRNAAGLTYWRERAERLECKYGDYWTIPPEDKP